MMGFPPVIGDSSQPPTAIVLGFAHPGMEEAHYLEDQDRGNCKNDSWQKKMHSFLLKDVNFLV